MIKNKTAKMIRRWNVGVILLIVSSIIFSCSVSAAHKHSWSKWMHTSDIHWKVCNTCGEYKQVEAHTLYAYKRVNATCSKNGYVKYKCKCGYKCKKILKSSNAHKYNNGVIIVNPTCYSNGIKKYTCLLCGKTKTKSISSNNSHYARYWDCNESGHWLNCELCGKRYNFAQHTFDRGVTNYNSNGGYSVTYTCTTCGYKKYDSGTQNCSHTARYWDCNESGHWLNCEKCYTRYNIASHNFDQGIVTTDNGNNYVITYTCKTCGYKKTETKSKTCSHTARYWDCNESSHWLNCEKCHAKYNTASHNFDQGVITTDNGNNYVITYTCKICGYKKTETKSKTCSHTARFWDCNDRSHWLNCDKCHTKYSISSHNFDGGVVIRSSGNNYIVKYTCKVCGYGKEVSCQRDEAKSVGSIYLWFIGDNFHLGDVVTFSLKYSGVDILKNVKVYLDDKEVDPKILNFAYVDDHLATYTLNTSTLRRGSIKFVITTDNCTQVTTYLTIN